MSRLQIGRTNGCNFIIDDPSVSRTHAEIALEGRELIIYDLDSNNGTFVLREGESHRVEEQMIIFVHDNLMFGSSGPYNVQQILDQSLGSDNYAHWSDVSQISNIQASQNEDFVPSAEFSNEPPPAEVFGPTGLDPKHLNSSDEPPSMSEIQIPEPNEKYDVNSEFAQPEINSFESENSQPTQVERSEIADRRTLEEDRRSEERGDDRRQFAERRKTDRGKAYRGQGAEEKKVRCLSCGSVVVEAWAECPYCGANI